MKAEFSRELKEKENWDKRNKKKTQFRNDQSTKVSTFI
jgi:hypothetical protein